MDERKKDVLPGSSKFKINLELFSMYSQVPMGTVISSISGQELANLECDGDYYIAGRGGAGGRGNKFYLSNENRGPSVAEKGAKGEHQRLRVELRTMANVGLVC